MLCIGCYAGGRNDDSFAGSGSTAPDASSTSSNVPGDPTGSEITTGEESPTLYCWDLDGACVSPAPSGWTGPFFVYDGPPSSAPPCPAELPKQVLAGHDELQPPDGAQCDACTCGGPSGGTCGAVPLTAYQMPDPGACGGCSTDYLVPADTCFEILACGDPLGSIVMQAAPANGGTCTPSVPDATLPTLQWARAAVGCAPPALTPPGCGADSQCLPAPPPMFEAGACIVRTGDVECPGHPYDQKRRFYLGAIDERGCDACTCGVAHDAKCHGQIKVFDSNYAVCDVQEVHYDVPQDCTWKSGDHWVTVVLDPPQGGACDPAGGGPVGTASPDQPVTLCCGDPQAPRPVG